MKQTKNQTEILAQNSFVGPSEVKGYKMTDLG